MKMSLCLKADLTLEWLDAGMLEGEQSATNIAGKLDRCGMSIAFRKADILALTVRERILFCVGSGTDWQRAGALSIWRCCRSGAGRGDRI